uniref:Uncharacterized protein n=1 Tax=Anguilla anguilla TaxID=7936 RepID=A0A0E9SJL0_ANGAN
MERQQSYFNSTAERLALPSPLARRKIVIQKELKIISWQEPCAARSPEAFILFPHYYKL